MSDIHYLKLAHLVKVENDVQLAHVAEIAVQDLDVLVDDFERQKLVVILINTRDKI
jgi:hypothetical protein